MQQIFGLCCKTDASNIRQLLGMFEVTCSLLQIDLNDTNAQEEFSKLEQKYRERKES